MKDNKQRLFEVMQKVNSDFNKPLNMKNEINRIGRLLSKKYILTINYQLPYISLTNNPSKEELEEPNQEWIPQYKKKYMTKAEHSLIDPMWYTQGDEAQELIDKIPEGINPEYYLLWYLESAGIIVDPYLK